MCMKNGQNTLQNRARKSTDFRFENDDRFQTLSETGGIINVGITTGNNKYFSVDKKMVEVYDLTNVVRPLIGRSSLMHIVFSLNMRTGRKMLSREKKRLI